MKFLTRLAHALFGFISTLAVLVHPILPALSLVLFIVYELVEVSGPERCQELCEYAAGVAAALTILLAAKLSAGL